MLIFTTGYENCANGDEHRCCSVLLFFDSTNMAAMYIDESVPKFNVAGKCMVE
jgi:hypothetical protein